MRFCIILVFLLVLMPNNIVGEEILLDSDSYVKVYYFRSNFRCANCYKIEEYTKEVIEEFLKEESNAERLVYEVANIDEEKNYHFVEDYQLYTKSVVISIIKNGEEVKYKNLQKIWEHLNDRKKFHKYIREEISNFMNESEGRKL